MPISIDWGNKVIYVPQNYLTLITGTLYELDTDQFRLDLKGLEDDDEGMPFPDTHRHVTETTIAGVTYARFIEIINGYSITFEDGQYSVRLSGSNNNFFDVENGILNQNQVQVIPGNSAGLIRVETGVSGLTPEESEQLLSLPDADEVADSVWNELMAEHSVDGSFGNIMSRILDTSEIERGTVQDTGASTTKFITSLTGVNGFWDRSPILFTSGQCTDQARGIKTSKSNGEITLETPLSHTPANGDKFVVFVGRKFLAPDLDLVLSTVEGIDSRLPLDPASQSAVESALPDVSDLAKQSELLRALGLMQENFKYEPLTHDSNGRPTSGRITIYSDNNMTIPMAIYNVIQSWNGDLLQSYAVSRSL